MDNKVPNIGDTETSILIVDDNTQYTKLLTRILTGVFGYKNITSVESTEQAYSKLSSEPSKFDLLFVDYNFPGGETGGNLLERLKNAKLLDGKVAFLITSEPTVDNLKKAVAAGALGVVAKPFDRDELKKQLDKAQRSIIADHTESF